MKKTSKPADFKLEAFLYFLLRDHLPIGKVEEIKAQIQQLQENELIPYSSPFVKKYAHELMEDLKREWIAK